MESRILYVASSNPGKQREFRQAAAPRGVTVAMLPHFEELSPCGEDGATFRENALKKAIYYSRGVPDLVFADDSGLAVDALGGAPGVHSARYAGPDATDEENNKRLLTDLRRVEGEFHSQVGNRTNAHVPFNRAAHYECVIALAQHGQALTVVEGRVDGIIIAEPRGQGGFGYDPYFFYPPLGKTFAEISAEEKSAVSHRGAAFRKLLDALNRKR